MVLIAACGPGWLPILESLCSLLHERNLRGGEASGHLHAIKEKFGGIRILLNGSSEEMQAWVDFALTHSMRTCELCGGPGRLVVTDGWQRTRCEVHLDAPAHLAD
ncbi:hypothetical protein [Pseudomonas sp. RIT-To-2]|uniref:hypothetical protein n=1 Tax=Pseudomonas sp. RIT-To-2 TaxID=3462541 RepID=UPI0024130C82